MLPKKNKLRSEYRIERVFLKGRFFKTPFFKLHYYPNTYRLFAAVSIPKALKLTAVKRNRARRRVFSALEKVWPLAKGKNYDMVVNVRGSRILEAPFEKIVFSLQDFFKKLP